MFPKLNNLNDELLNDLNNLSISDLRGLRKTHVRIQKIVQEEMNDMASSKPGNDVTNHVKQVNQEKSIQFHLLIDEAIRKNYFQFFNRVKV